MRIAALVFWLAGTLGPGLAHPDFEERITELTAALQREPGNAELLVQRGEAQRRLGRFEPALADFGEAARLSPGSGAAALGRAQTFYDAGRTGEALKAAEEFLRVRPESTDGLVLRGRCCVRLGQGVQALGDYDKAIALGGEPTPDLFVERARLQAALGRLEEAVTGLDEGLRRLGDAPGLELAAIEYERQRGAFERALARVARVAERSRVKEPWLAMRAEVLEQAGRLREAQEAFETALRAMESWSPGRRRAEVNRRLEQRVKEGIERTKGKVAALKRRSVGARERVDAGRGVGEKH